MLRNLAETVPAGRPLAGARVFGGYLWGKTGAEILAASGSGTHGPGPLANDGLASATRYRLVVDAGSSFPAGGLSINDLGQLRATASGAATYQLLADNLVVAADAADRSIVVIIGAIALTLADNGQVGPATSTPLVGRVVALDAAGELRARAAFARGDRPLAMQAGGPVLLAPL